MITIKCAKCKTKLIKYHKIGKGKILRCWYKKIVADFTVHQDEEARCSCGNVIGTLDHQKINMRQHAFEYSGTVVKKGNHA